jgi:hypothetical protein
MLSREDASDIIHEVTDAIRDWQKVATGNQIPVRILEQYQDRWTNPIS